MIWIILIAAIVAYIILAAKYGTKPVIPQGLNTVERYSKTQISINDKNTIDEVINLLRMIQGLYSGEIKLQNDELGYLQILPVDDNDKLYCANSSRVLIYMILFNDNEWGKKSVYNVARINDTGFEYMFNTEYMFGNTGFTARTGCRFSSNYKSFIPILYNEIEKCFPGRFTTDGVIIKCKANFGEAMF